MTLKQALKRIEELERKVAQLEARPEQHVHYHTHPATPMPQPIGPMWSPPFYPRPYEVTCGIGGVDYPMMGLPQNAN